MSTILAARSSRDKPLHSVRTSSRIFRSTEYMLLMKAKPQLAIASCLAASLKRFRACCQQPTSMILPPDSR